MMEGGFTLRKWTANNDELKYIISLSEKEICDETEVNTSDTENKVLGISWDVERDALFFFSV